MYRIDKTPQLLIMATWQFDVIKNCLTLTAFEIAQTPSVWTLFELQSFFFDYKSFIWLQIQKMSSTSLHVCTLSTSF